MRILSYISAFIVTALLLSACAPKPPNMPNTPVISFNSFQGTGANSGILKINFTEGDGDIGYPAQDISAPFDFWAKYTYYSYSLKKFVAVWNPNTLDTVYYAYHLPNITPSGKDKSLKGTIGINMDGWFTNPFSTQDSIQYLKVQMQVWIFDRAGNKSNVITTRTLYPGSPNP